MAKAYTSFEHLGAAMSREPKAQCDGCNGTGLYGGGTCPGCDGEGELTASEKEDRAQDFADMVVNAGRAARGEKVKARTPRVQPRSTPGAAAVKTMAKNERWAAEVARRNMLPNK